jgi:hypothetical protein
MIPFSDDQVMEAYAAVLVLYATALVLMAWSSRRR